MPIESYSNYNDNNVDKHEITLYLCVTETAHQISETGCLSIRWTTDLHTKISVVSSN